MASEGISVPHQHDVLSGRGNNINSSPGNQFYRKLVKSVRVEYVATPKHKKSTFAKLVVHAVRSMDPPGRFLQIKEKEKLFYEIGEKKAVDKTRQALREGAPEVERQIEEGKVTVREGPLKTVILDEAKRIYEEHYAQWDEAPFLAVQQQLPPVVPSQQQQASVQDEMQVNPNQLQQEAQIGMMVNGKFYATGTVQSVDVNPVGLNNSFHSQVYQERFLPDSNANNAQEEFLPQSQRSSLNVDNQRSFQSGRPRMISTTGSTSGSSRSLQSAGNSFISQTTPFDRFSSLKSSVYSQHSSGRSLISNGMSLTGSISHNNYQDPYSQGVYSNDAQEAFLPTSSHDFNTGNQAPFGVGRSSMASNGSNRALLSAAVSQKAYQEPISEGGYTNNTQEAACLPPSPQNDQQEFDSGTHNMGPPTSGTSNSRSLQARIQPDRNLGHLHRSAPPGSFSALASSQYSHGPDRRSLQNESSVNADQNAPDQSLKNPTNITSGYSPNSRNRRVSFKASPHPHTQYEDFPTSSTDHIPLNSQKPDPNSDTDWNKRNSLHLADLDQRFRSERRRSSIMALNYVKIVEGLEDDDDSDYDDDVVIEERLREIAKSFGGGGGGDRTQSQGGNRDSQAIESLASSMRTSLNINDVFDEVNEKSFRRASKRASTRMSLCSRRSTRMSLLLRQSFLDSFMSEEGDSDADQSKTKHHIPDVFSSKRNRRGSIVTSSTTQLVSTVFGEEAAKIASTDQNRESFLLRSALDPVNADELMMEICKMEDCEDFVTEDMDECEWNISQLVDAGVREERRRVKAEVQMDSLNFATEDIDDEEDDLHSSFLNSSMDLSLSSSLTKKLRDRSESKQNS